MNTPESFKAFCIIELFGHNKIAGEVSEQTIGGASFVRVDVPATSHRDGFTKLYGASAIYGISPVSKEICLAMAERLDVTPITAFELRIITEQLEKKALPEPEKAINPFEGEEEEQWPPDDYDRYKDNMSRPI